MGWNEHLAVQLDIDHTSPSLGGRADIVSTTIPTQRWDADGAAIVSRLVHELAERVGVERAANGVLNVYTVGKGTTRVRLVAAP